MYQEPLASELSNLERKLKLLLNEYYSQKEEIRLLKTENESLKNSLDSKQTELINFQNNHKISSIVNSVAVDDVSTAELKQQINTYIKEIDRCIAHFNE
jgi:uncharacterized UBP type Zn finger protein